jgi:hypothetical protein
MLTNLQPMSVEILFSTSDTLSNVNDGIWFIDPSYDVIATSSSCFLLSKFNKYYFVPHFHTIGFKANALRSQFCQQLRPEDITNGRDDSAPSLPSATTAAVATAAAAVAFCSPGENNTRERGKKGGTEEGSGVRKTQLGRCGRQLLCIADILVI